VLAKKICNELQWICSDNASSILKNKGDNALLKFDWQQIFDEAKQHTPIFFDLLLNLFGMHNKQQAIIAIGTIFSIVCHMKRDTMNQYQRLISVILYAGHCSKQVCAILLSSIVMHQLSHYF